MCKKSVHISGTYKGKSGKITFTIPLFIFPEDNIIMAYCPILDITGYGRNEDEAIKSFHVMLNEFLEYTEENKTLHAELTKLGWKFNQRKPLPPDIAALVMKNDTLRNIINNHDYSKRSIKTSIPQHAFC